MKRRNHACKYKEIRMIESITMRNCAEFTVLFKGDMNGYSNT